MKVPKSEQPIALVCVGSAVPDRPEYFGPAFSRAGALFQGSLLAALKATGSGLDLVLSVRPVPSFPRSRRAWVSPARDVLDGGVPIRLLGFLNVTPLKQLWIGVATALGILGWAMRTRGRQRVVYTYNLTVPPGLFTLAAARLSGCSAVASINDVNLPGQTVPDGFFERLDFALQRWLMPRFDGLVVVTDAIRQDFAPNTPAIRLEGGIRPELFGSSRVRREDDGTFLVAAAGSLDEANGIHTILEAFGLLRGDRYRLVVAGGGPLEGLVRRAANSDRRIRYAGFLSFQKVLELYERSDVLVSMRLTRALDTRYFFPSKMMEFLASGTPVISTCTGHAEEEFGDLCYLLRDETPEGLAAVIERVEREPLELREALGARARAYMASNKTWEAQARRLWRFLGTLTSAS